MIAVVTLEMQEVVKKIARKYRVAEWGVLMIASAMGPASWRGCVPVQEYRPRPNH